MAKVKNGSSSTGSSWPGLSTKWACCLFLFAINLFIRVSWLVFSACSVLGLTDLSVSSFHISPPFFVSSVTEIPGNSSLILGRFSFSHRKYADCGLFGLSGSTSFFDYQRKTNIKTETYTHCFNDHFPSKPNLASSHLILPPYSPLSFCLHWRVTGSVSNLWKTYCRNSQSNLTWSNFRRAGLSNKWKTW